MTTGFSKKQLKGVSLWALVAGLTLVGSDIACADPPIDISGGSATITGDINFGNNGSTGIKADNGATVTMDPSIDEISITSSARYVTGLHALNNSTIEMTGDMTLTGSGSFLNPGSVGIKAEGGSNVTYQGNMIISDGIAIDAAVGSKVEFTGDITVNSDNEDTGVNVYGENSTVKLTGNLKSSGERVEAVWVRDGGHFELDGTITTDGRGSAAVAVDNGFGGMGAASASVKGKIETSGNGSWGQGSQYWIGSHGVLVRAGRSDGSSAEVDADITTTGNMSFGLYALRGGIINVRYNGDLRTIQTTGDSSHAVYASNGGEINLESVKIVADYEKNSYAILAKNDNDPRVPGNENTKPLGWDEAATISGDGQFHIDGAIGAEDLGTVDLIMQAGSTFVGSSHVEGADAAVNLDMRSSNWEMVRDSTVTKLTMDSASTVTFATATETGTLTVDDLYGSGNFVMRSYVSDIKSDLIVVKKTSEGSHNLAFDDGSTGGATGLEEVLVVRFDGTNPDDNEATFNSPGVDLGQYQFVLIQKEDGNWYLVSSGELNNGGKTSTSFLNANYFLGFVENQTLLQRLGELRNAPRERDTDIWARSFGGGLDHFGNGRLSGFKMTYFGLQAGIDHRYDVSADSQIFVGLMGGYTSANLSFGVGDGDAEHFHVGAYGTYRHDSGLYVDVIGKYLRLEDSYNTLTSNGYRIDGSGGGNGLSLGVEVGKRFYFDEPKSGWYAEPQGQFTWTHMSDVEIKSSNGLKTDLGGYDSLLGRASVIVGYSFASDKTPIDLYFKTGYLREFGGKTDYTFNDTYRESYDMKSGWWDNGIGLNMQIDQNNNLYFDASYAVGGSFNQWQFNLGYRYQF